MAPHSSTLAWKIPWTEEPGGLQSMVVMPSNHLILCRSLLLPSIFPSIRVFSSESVLHRTRTASGLGKILFLPCGHVRKIPSRYCLVNLGARNPDREL